MMGCTRTCPGYRSMSRLHAKTGFQSYSNSIGTGSREKRHTAIGVMSIQKNVIIIETFVLYTCSKLKIGAR